MSRWKKKKRQSRLLEKTHQKPLPPQKKTPQNLNSSADANILINSARLAAQRHAFAFGEPVPVEQLVRALCDAKQGYTQFGGLRPYGVCLLYAGWDRERGFQLYQSDPSGNYSGWKATAVGAGAAAAQAILRADYIKKKKKSGGGEEGAGASEEAKETSRRGRAADDRAGAGARGQGAVENDGLRRSHGGQGGALDHHAGTRRRATCGTRSSTRPTLAPLLEAANVEAAKAKEAEDK